MNIITFGTFDLFHIGHLNIIKFCNELKKNDNDKLIVGISSDELNYKKKGKYPVININDRMEIIRNIKGVDKVFIEYNLEDKINYCLDNNANVFVMGDDWYGKFDFLKKYDIDVIYKPRTKYISTTDIKKIIKKN